MTNENIRFKYVILLHMFQMMAAQVLCLIVVLCALKNKSRRCRMPSRITEHRKRVRDELMKQIMGNDRCRDIIRIGPQAFLNSCTILRDQGGNGYDDTIDDIDHLVSTNEVTLEGFDTYEEEYQPFTSPEVSFDGHFHSTTSSRAKKRARKVVEDDISMGHVAKSLEKMVEVLDNISKSTIELVEQNKNVAAEDVIWEQLEDIGVEPVFLPNVYVHLIHHRDAMKAFNGIPVHKRKEMLPRIVPGYPPNI